MAFLPSTRAFLSSAILAVAIAVYFSGIATKYISWPLSLFSSETPGFVCKPHQYTTEIVSVDPLLLYINNFTSLLENTALVTAGAPHLKPSEIYLDNEKRPSSERTSKSAGLDPFLPVVQCVLARARVFLGTLLDEHDDFGTPQLVRYQAGERFDTHHDWYDRPQRARDGTGRWWNRVGSFFVFLEEVGEEDGGETWFPFIGDGAVSKGRGGRGGSRDGKGNEKGRWRNHEDGGLAFRPREGSALFWINLHGNGTGDGRVVHAGLPLKRGRKTAMNVWPRKYFGRV